MNPEPVEPTLPYTPSHTGRRARVGYLGFEGVGFNDLWPLFLGTGASVALGLEFFVGGAAGPSWPSKTAAALLPFLAGFGYLRFLVVGRPPHFKGDLWETALGLRLDFTEPALRALPIVPSLRIDRSAATGPARAADLVHPARRGARPSRGGP